MNGRKTINDAVRRAGRRTLFAGIVRLALASLGVSGAFAAPAFGEDRFTLAVVPDAQLETGDS